MKYVYHIFIILIFFPFFSNGQMQMPSYDSAFAFSVNQSILDIVVVNDEKELLVSTATGVWSFSLDNYELRKLKIKNKDLPEEYYNRKESKDSSKIASNPSPFTKSILSSDGNYLIYFSLQHQYKNIYVYKKRRNRYKLHYVIKNPSNVNSVAISEDLILAAGSSHGQIRLWDLKDKSFIRLMEPNIAEGYVKHIVFSNSSRMAIGNGSLQSIVINYPLDSVENLWSFGMYKKPNAPGAYGQGVKQLEFAEDDSLVFIIIENLVFNALNIWDLNSNLIKQLPLDSINPVSFCYNKDHLFVANKNGGIRIYNLIKSQIINSFPSRQKALSRVLLSPTRKKLITVNKSGQIKIWNQNSELKQNIN